jgi:hypothetical protein
LTTLTTSSPPSYSHGIGTFVCETERDGAAVDERRAAPPLPRGGVLTSADAEIVGMLAAAGYEIGHSAGYGEYGWRVYGLQQQLRALGLLRNKHVPKLQQKQKAVKKLQLLRLNRSASKKRKVPLSILSKKKLLHLQLGQCLFDLHLDE